MESVSPTDRAEYYAPIAKAVTPESMRDWLLLKLLGARTLLLDSDNPSRNWDWIGTALIVALAAVLRFWALGQPATLVFDETYYVKDAFTLWRLGFEADWPENANEAFAAGDPSGYLTRAAFVVHPQVGKWLIALGMALGGGATNPVAWRMASAIFGVLAVWLVIRIARRLFASTIIGLIAGLLMAVDGGAIVHSRTALLDQFLMVFVLAAFWALLLDRQKSRYRLADAISAPFAKPQFRWLRLVAGVLLGLACGVKWSGVYFVAVFGLLTVWWDFQARKQLAKAQKRLADEAAYQPANQLEPLHFNSDRPIMPVVEPVETTRVFARSTWRDISFWQDAGVAFLSIVPVALVTYVATWFSWFITPGAWGRDWAANNPGQGVTWLPPLLRSFWQYHRQMWTFHTTLVGEHPYSANPLGWLIQWRPTAFYWRHGEELADFPGCAGISDCVTTVTSLGNPLLWWLAFGTLLLIVTGLIRRDWRALAALSGIIAGWTPWLLHTDRTIFTFYSIVFTPWVIFTLCYAFTILLEGRQPGYAHPQRDYSPVNIHGSSLSPSLWRSSTRSAKIVVAILVIAILVVSTFFYPIWTARPIEFNQWQNLMWLDSWI